LNGRPGRAAEDLPHIVLLPGMDGTGSLFQPLVREFPPTVGVSIVSYPGDIASTYPELVSIVAKAVPRGVPYILVAESYSGPVAILLAATQPDLLRGVVLSASFASNPLPMWLRWTSMFQRFPWPAMALPRGVLRLLLAGGGSPREIPDAVRAALGRVKPAVLLHRVRQVLGVDVSSALREVRVPMLYLAGSRDRLVGLRGLAQIRRARPEVRTAVLVAPHLLLQASPGEAAQAIVGFAREL
jgi:pimeloyl-ACP methyl ester carboxylesterase